MILNEDNKSNKSQMPLAHASSSVFYEALIEKQKSHQEERKEFWKAVYIEAVNSDHHRLTSIYRVADEALKEFDKRFKQEQQ